MLQTKPLKTQQLIDGFTGDMLNSDSGEQNIQQSFAISTFGRELINGGKEVIPKISTYLTSIEDVLQKVILVPEKENIKRGWVLLLVEIVRKENIDMRCLASTFDEWKNWAANYKP